MNYTTPAAIIMHILQKDEWWTLEVHDRQW
jgi:hypothetical protein